MFSSNNKLERAEIVAKGALNDSFVGTERENFLDYLNNSRREAREQLNQVRVRANGEEEKSDSQKPVNHNVVVVERPIIELENNLKRANKIEKLLLQQTRDQNSSLVISQHNVKPTFASSNNNNSFGKFFMAVERGEEKGLNETKKKKQRITSEEGQQQLFSLQQADNKTVRLSSLPADRQAEQKEQQKQKQMIEDRGGSSSHHHELRKDDNNHELDQNGLHHKLSRQSNNESGLNVIGKGRVTLEVLDNNGNNSSSNLPTSSKQNSTLHIQPGDRPARRGKLDEDTTVASSSNNNKSKEIADSSVLVEQEAAEAQISRAIEESVEKQVVEQFSANSDLGRQLRRQFSAYFGRPVVIKATVIKPTSAPHLSQLEFLSSSSSKQQQPQVARVVSKETNQRQPQVVAPLR